MGARGPSPETEQLTAPSGKPPLPFRLSETATTAWEGLVCDMEEVGTLARTDGAAIEACARLMARASDLAGIIETEGWTYEDRSSIKARPEAALLATHERMIQSYLIQFGLTPIARSRVRVERPDPNDPLAKYGD